MAVANPLPVLNRRFTAAVDYAAALDGSYALMPFRFIRLDNDRYVATNFVGESSIFTRESLQRFVDHRLEPNSPLYDELKSKHFFIDGDSSVGVDLLAVKYRTRQSLLAQFTSLFMFVVTLRCDHSCHYCQVSRQSASRNAYDMRRDDADRAIEFVFRSPSPLIKVEFQGGEPLLNFDLIRYIVERAEDRNSTEARNIQFVIATNLVLLSDEILDFCKEHGVLLSTSLDGPRHLHNANRPRPGGDSYERTIENLLRARKFLGPEQVAALMTTTEASLPHYREIIDEYRRQGFDSIFLRSISPYGFAVKTGAARAYETDRWLDFYRDALDYMLELNANGETFREEYTSLLLRKILTPFPTGYVDLQSPAGIGIGGLVFNYDGDVYASDESRMLAEMGDKEFRLGNLASDSYEQIMLSPVLVETLERTMTEVMPMCSDCGFQPYCGSDPVQHYATQGDVVGYKPSSDFCKKQMGVLRHIFRLLEDDSVAADILRSWV